jgi:CheY-like chemotaxis protein
LLAASELAGDPGLDPLVRAQCEMIRRNVELEARLIDDLLDLTRISRGRLEIRRKPTDLHEVLRQTELIVRSELTDRLLKLEFQLTAGSHHVLGDDVRLQQVCWNLLKNAVKFTADGGTIIVRTEELPSQRIRIEVKDTGRGISAESLGRLFQPFQQGDLAGRHQFEGLGLGLSIARAIVELHGGRITATSDGIGCGATFLVELDLVAARSAAPPSSPATQATSELRLLIVDDHEPTRATMTQLLRRRGHVVQAAGSVAEGLSAATASSFDIVISDLGLPDGSGIDLMREISRTRGWPGIALSGFGMSVDIEKSLAAGFCSHLVKPLEMAQLDQAIAKAVALGRKTSPDETATSATPQP